MMCEYCFDTGCACGGIGISCHGCCDCEEGQKARERRQMALAEVAKFFGVEKLEDEKR